jgi:hypothetical protein
VAQVVKCLPGKCEALSSNLSTEKKNKILQEVNSLENWVKLQKRGPDG